MASNNVFCIKTADPDSHFRLRPCAECCGNAVYVLRRENSADLWRVECGCGCVGGMSTTRHGAQVLWNQMQMEAGV